MQMFFLMNKPRGYVCQRDPTVPNVYDLIPQELRSRLSCFGRLDRDTTGMLLFGTDGCVQSLLLSPSSRVWKTYTAEIFESCDKLDPRAAELFRSGTENPI